MKLTADVAATLHSMPDMHEMVIYTSLQISMIRHLICRISQTDLYLVCPLNLFKQYGDVHASMKFSFKGNMVMLDYTSHLLGRNKSH